ncbi:MAG: hypothetical protein MUC63_07775, partial [Planctomycetes bacterium]|nr:hypothetical protein [Planctomycetota bacterium]
MQKNLLFLVSLLAALATLAVLAWVGAERWGEIGPAAERAWRERAAAYLGTTRAATAAAWTRTEDGWLQGARQCLENRRTGVPADPRSSPPPGTLGWFALDGGLSPIQPEGEGDPWSPVAEIAAADAEGRVRLAEGERKEFQERNAEEALALYASAASPEHGVTLRTEARLAAGAAAFRLGRFPEAARFYRTIRDDPVPSGIAPWVRAVAMHREALALERAGDPAGAAEALEELLRRLVRRGRKAPLAGLERSRRAFLFEAALADFERATGRPGAGTGFRWDWKGFLDDGETLDAVLESVVPALRRDSPSSGRRVRLAAPFGDRTALAVVQREGATAVGVFVALVPASREGGKPPESAPFFGSVRMPGRDAADPGVLASAPLFDDSPAPVLCASARDPGEIPREAARRRALLAALLALAGAGLLAGTFLVLRRLKKEMDLSR